MKLPASNRMGVQSLGRDDVNAPAREWQARTQVRQEMGKAVTNIATEINDIVEAQGEHEALLLMQQRLIEDKKRIAEASNTLATTNKFNMNDEQSVPPDLMDFYMQNEVKYATPDGMVNSEDISEDYLNHITKSYSEESMNQLAKTRYGKKLRSTYLQNMSGTILESTQNATIDRLKKKNARNRATADGTLENLISSGDEQASVRFIEETMNAGIYGEEEAIKMMNELPGKIQFAQASEAISTSANAGELDNLSNAVYGEEYEQMSIEQKNQLSAKAYSKAKAIETARLAQFNLNKEQASGDIRSNLTGMMYLGETVTPQMIADSGMNGTDKIATWALHKQLTSGSTIVTTSPESMRNIQMAMTTLMAPNINTVGIRAEAVNQLITEEMMANRVAPDDVAKLRSQVNSMIGIPFNTPQYKEARDNIFRTIVGGTEKDPYAMGNATPAAKMQAQLMVQSMQVAYTQQGESFDPVGWVDENMTRFMLSGNVSAEETRVEQLFKANVVIDEKKREKFPESKEKFKQMFDNGDIDDDTYTRFIEKLEQKERLYIKLGITDD